jgi:hypothetical protein
MTILLRYLCFLLFQFFLFEQEETEITKGFRRSDSTMCFR